MGSGRGTTTASSVCSSSLKSITLAPATARPRGRPRPSVSRDRLVPSLERSVGLGPTFFPAQRCLGHCSVCRHPTPINPDQAVIGQQPLTPEGLEHTGLGPFAKTAVGGRWRTDAGGFERLPLTTRAQDKEDRVHRGAIWNPRIMAAQRMRWTLRQQRLHAPPELIRQPPAIVLDQSPHRDLHPLKSKSPTAQIRQAPYWNRLLGSQPCGNRRFRLIPPDAPGLGPHRGQFPGDRPRAMRGTQPRRSPGCGIRGDDARIGIPAAQT